MIDWLNIRTLDYLNAEPLIKYNMDLTPIYNNAWLAGLIDADGNFNVIIAPRKNTNNVRIQAQFRIELRQHYHRDILITGSTSYIDILSIIANYLGVNVYNRSRFVGNSITYQYYFVAGSKKSQSLIINYLNNFPLFSSKYLDYKDWCEIIKISNSILTKEEKINKSNILKSGINNKRTLFTWNHLKHFPL